MTPFLPTAEFIDWATPDNVKTVVDDRAGGDAWQTVAFASLRQQAIPVAITVVYICPAGLVPAGLDLDGPSPVAVTADGSWLAFIAGAA